jgi:DNA mismatch repair protein MutS
VVNFSVAVREVGDDIVFLRRLVAGGADRSYGVEVARLAGLPESVVERARAILRELEEQSAAAPAPPSAEQLVLFEGGLPHPAVERLRKLDVDALTPLQALNLLAELAKLARG